MFSGGSNRQALVHVPKSSASSGRFPVVLVLHGFGDSSELVEEQTAFSKKADQAGFHHVYHPSCGLIVGEARLCQRSPRPEIESVAEGKHQIRAAARGDQA